MGRLLSRQEAADYLGVNRQTVSNWLESGILHDVGKNRQTLIDKNSLDKFFDTYKDLAVMEEKIAAAKERTEQLLQETEKRMLDIRKAHGIVSIVGEDAIRIQFLEMILALALEARCINHREHRILWGIVHRKPLDEIVAEDWSGRANVMQIAHKAIHKIAEMNDYADIKRELADMKKKSALGEQIINDQNEEIARQKAELAKYEKRQEEESDDDTDDQEILAMRQLLKTRIVDLNLTVRCLTCLKSQDIETLGDAVQYNKTDFLKFRNFGKKSLTELDDLFDSLGLHFGMDISKYVKKGAKLEYDSYGSNS